MQAVAFATFLLGLTTGVHPVRLLVADGVAQVELMLDDATVATLHEPPWTAHCDLGDELAPHALTAVARDASGSLVGTARQLVNLPRAQAEISLILEHPGNGPAQLRLAWQSTVASDPRKLDLTLDGTPIPVVRPDRIVLPPHDPATFHLLHARLTFADGVSAESELGFGGGFGDTVATELTAVPVAIASRHRVPDREELASRILARGKPAHVLAVDEGDAEAIVVVERGAETLLDAMIENLTSEEGRRRRRARRTVINEHSEVVNGMLVTHPGFALPADDPVRGTSGGCPLRLLRPFAETEERDGATWERFRASQAIPREEGALPWIVRVIPPSVDTTAPQSVADAVAFAGLLASSRGQRRAVVLLISNQPDDASRFDPRNAMRFLERLHVPLLVWSPERRPDRESAWGKPVEVSNARLLSAAIDDLDALLDRQRIVWVEGPHLPQDVALAPGRGDLQLAGAREPGLREESPARP